MQEIKKEVRTVLENLPDDCTLEDVQYHLYVMQKVRNGIDALDRGESIKHQEAVNRLGKWLLK